MLSVADVSTVVDRANSRDRSSPATDNGATRSAERTAGARRNGTPCCEGRPPAAGNSVSPPSSQTTSVRSGIGGSNEARIRAAVSAISANAAIASERAAAACGSPGDGLIGGAGVVRGVAQRGQVGGQLVVEVVDAARGGVVDRRTEGG